MKKLITSIFIVFMMITTIIPVNALEENKSIDYLSNGDYIETTITSNMNTLARSSKSGTKTEKYKNASGEVMWSLSNKKVSKSGNKAIASVTGHAPGVTVTRTVTLTCSPSGKLS